MVVMVGKRISTRASFTLAKTTLTKFNMIWQLWLGKELVQDHHLPWQKPQKNLTPQRVSQSMISLLIEIGSLTRVPKTRGKSVGCQKGQTRTKRKRYS